MPTHKQKQEYCACRQPALPQPILPPFTIHNPFSPSRVYSARRAANALLFAAVALSSACTPVRADTPAAPDNAQPLFASSTPAPFFFPPLPDLRRPRLTAERLLRGGKREEEKRRRGEEELEQGTGVAFQQTTNNKQQTTTGSEAFSSSPLLLFSSSDPGDEQILPLDDMRDTTVISVRARPAPARAAVDDTRPSITLENALPFAAPPMQYGPITARNFRQYSQDVENGIFTYSGGVEIVYTDPRTNAQTTLNADSAEYNYRTGLITAHRGARLERTEGSFVGDAITYNIITQAGFTTNAIAETDYFRMRGARIEALADGSYVVEDGVFTTCIRGRPDYQIRAKRLTIKPNQYVSARGVTIFAGPTALITLPSLRRNLATTSSVPIPTPGYNKSEGIFARLHDTPILDPHRSLQYDGHVDVRRLPAGFVTYEFDVARTAPRAPSPRTLRIGLEDPLHGYLEQLTPPTYREYAENRYEDEFAPRTTVGVVVQNDQYVYNRRRTDLRVSRFPEFAVRLVNVLGRVNDPATLQDQEQNAPRSRDGSPNNPLGAAINPVLQRTSSAPFLLDFDLRAGAVTEYPTRLTSGRASLLTTAATQPFRVGRRISFRFAVSDWLNAYTQSGTMYNLFSPETELDYLPTRTTRLGVGYRISDDLGRTPFAFDRQDVRHELRLLFQTGGPTAFGYEAKFDLERSRQYDGEFAVLRNFDCMQVGLAYRQRTQSFSVIFNLLPPTRDRASRRAQPLQAVPGSRPGG